VARRRQGRKRQARGAALRHAARSAGRVPRGQEAHRFQRARRPRARPSAALGARRNLRHHNPMIMQCHKQPALRGTAKRAGAMRVSRHQCAAGMSNAFDEGGAARSGPYAASAQSLCEV